MKDNKNIGVFYDNPLKSTGMEIDHDAADAAHFDDEADRFLAEEGKEALVVDFHEDMPPRHRAFWLELLDAPGKRILDVGCGYGYSAARLAMMGANVVAIDVSKKMCDLTRLAAEVNDVEIDVHNASAVNTGFPDDEFDIIVGQVSLHHLPLESSGRELKRILKPGGRAVFLEPIHTFKWIFDLRSRLPVACYESPGGGALRIEEIRELGNFFGDYKIRYFSVLERLRRFKPLDWISPILYAADTTLLKLPGTKGLSSAAVIVLKKTKS